MDAMAPASGTPAAAKPPNIRTITSRVRGRERPSPFLRSASTWLVIVSTSCLMLVTSTVEPGTSWGSCSNRSSTAWWACSCSGSARAGSRTTVTRAESPSVETAAGPTVVGSMTCSTPGIAMRSAFTVAAEARNSLDCGSTPSQRAWMLDPVGSFSASSARPSRASPATVGSPSSSRSNRDCPPTPSAATRYAPTASRTLMSATAFACRAIAAPWRARIPVGIGSSRVGVVAVRGSSC